MYGTQPVHKVSEPNHLENAIENLKLSPEHREYLLKRHGTTELNPLPSASPDDPLNWPTWRKHVQILMVAFHSMITTFMAAAIIPAYSDLAKLYNVSVTSASYLTGVQILFLGISPLIWCPIASRFGRRPIFLASTLGSFACNMGGAWCTSYGTQMVTRILTAICISPALGIGSAVATELFFAQERAEKLGWWTLMTTLGTPAGPFIMGFVTQHLGVQWIFWILAIINFCQFLGHLFLGGETLYRPNQNSRESQNNLTQTGVESTKSPFRMVKRIDPTPLCLQSFTSPFELIIKKSVMIPACAYAVVFCYANIALIVEMPIIFEEKFHLDAQDIGLQYIALIIGSVIGEQVSGPLSDFVQRRHDRQLQRSHRSDAVAGAAAAAAAAPTHRLWFSYLGFITVFVGLIVWGVQIQNATTGVWNVTPLIGAAIAAFGNQIITTTLIAYAVDCYRDRSMDVGVLVNLIRQVWGFVGPFYLPIMFSTLGFAASAGLMVAVVAACGMLPVIGLHFFASRKLEGAGREEDPCK